MAYGKWRYATRPCHTCYTCHVTKYTGPLANTPSDNRAHIQQFLDHMIATEELAEDPTAACWTAYLLDYYRLYCQRHAITALSDTAVGTTLAQMGYPGLRGGSGRRLRGGLRLTRGFNNPPGKPIKLDH